MGVGDQNLILNLCLDLVSRLPKLLVGSWYGPLAPMSPRPRNSCGLPWKPSTFTNKVLPLPLGRGVCETKSKNGRSRPRKPFISRVFCAQRGIDGDCHLLPQKHRPTCKDILANSVQSRLFSMPTSLQLSVRAQALSNHSKGNQQCANWVHCKRRDSEKSTFLAIFWEVLIFSGVPAL